LILMTVTDVCCNQQSKLYKTEQSRGEVDEPTDMHERTPAYVMAV